MVNSAESEAIERVNQLLKRLRESWKRTFNETLSRTCLFEAVRKRIEKDKEAMLEDLLNTRLKHFTTEDCFRAVELLKLEERLEVEQQNARRTKGQGRKADDGPFA